MVLWQYTLKKTTTSSLTGLVKGGMKRYPLLTRFLDSHLKLLHTPLAGASLVLADVMILTVVLVLCQQAFQDFHLTLALVFVTTLILVVMAQFVLNS
jgi:hypothetical protein